MLQCHFACQPMAASVKKKSHLFVYQVDNKGNHLLVHEESSINVPAIAAAHVIKRYIAQASDELSFEVTTTVLSLTHAHTILQYCVLRYTQFCSLLAKQVNLQTSPQDPLLKHRRQTKMIFSFFIRDFLSHILLSTYSDSLSKHNQKLFLLKSLALTR